MPDVEEQERVRVNCTLLYEEDGIQETTEDRRWRWFGLMLVQSGDGIPTEDETVDDIPHMEIEEQASPDINIQQDELP